MWCVIIPTYNNAGTIREVITNVRQYTRDIIVVNDGCTDDTLSVLDGMDVTVASHARNRGKGQALKTGFEKAREAGFDCAITMDADGQHLASDIPAFVQAARQHPGSLVVGCRDLSEQIFQLLVQAPNRHRPARHTNGIPPVSPETDREKNVVDDLALRSRTGIVNLRGMARHPANPGQDPRLLPAGAGTCHPLPPGI